MQLIGAYLIFLLAIVALGLGAILCGVLGIVLYEGAVWFRSAHLSVRRDLRLKVNGPRAGQLTQTVQH